MAIIPLHKVTLGSYPITNKSKIGPRSCRSFIQSIRGTVINPTSSSSTVPLFQCLSLPETSYQRDSSSTTIQQHSSKTSSEPAGIGYSMPSPKPANRPALPRYTSFKYFFPFFLRAPEDQSSRVETPWTAPVAASHQLRRIDGRLPSLLQVPLGFFGPCLWLSAVEVEPCRMDADSSLHPNYQK